LVFSRIAAQSFNPVFAMDLGEGEVNCAQERTPLWQLRVKLYQSKDVYVQLQEKQTQTIIFPKTKVRVVIHPDSETAYILTCM
jgi:hypothetical protein